MAAYFLAAEKAGKVRLSIRDFLVYLIDLAESYLIVLSVFILLLDTFVYHEAAHRKLILEADLVVSLMLVAAYLVRVANRGTLGYIVKSLWEWPGFIPLYMIYWIETTAHMSTTISGESELLLLLLRSVRFVRLGVLAIRTRELIRTFSLVFRDINFTRVFFLSVITVATSAAAYYVVEAGYSINNYWEALWFTIVTITTVGYGDITPSTTLGKAITVIIMVIGISLWALIIASLGTMFAEIVQKRIIGRELRRFEKRIKESIEREITEFEKSLAEEASRKEAKSSRMRTNSLVATNKLTSIEARANACLENVRELELSEFTIFISKLIELYNKLNTESSSIRASR